MRDVRKRRRSAIIWGAFALIVVVVTLVWKFILPSDQHFKTTAEFRKMGSDQIKLLNDTGEEVELEVKLADEPDEWQAGFQYIGERIIKRNLILFVFDREINARFHMRNVLAALDIAFIKSDGRIIAIMRMEPNAAETYGPDESFKYALEARAGFFKEHHISAGSSEMVVGSPP